MSKKPSFANLGSRLSQKAPDPAAAAPLEKMEDASASEAVTTDAIKRNRQPDGRASPLALLVGCHGCLLVVCYEYAMRTGPRGPPGQSDPSCSLLACRFSMAALSSAALR